MEKSLVPSTTTFPDQPQVDAELARFRDEGDLAALSEIADQATAYQEYERRQEAKGRADYFGRIKVMAEANIGAYDVKQNVTPRSGPLQLKDAKVLRQQRTQWRLLGSALLAGRLEVPITHLETDPNAEVTTFGVYRELRAQGFARIQAAPFRRRYLKLKRERGLTGVEIGRQIGIRPEHAHLYIGPRVKHIPYPVAARLAEVLELPPSQFRGIKHVSKPRKRRPLPRERKLVGGRLDETSSLVRKALQELDRATGQSNEWGTMDAWEHLYVAERIVGHAMKRAK